MRALAVLLLAPLFCAAQPVARPEVRVGDRWIYQRMDYDAGKPRGRYELEVVFAQRGVIQTVSTHGDERETDMTYTADWNAVTLHGRVFNPHSSWLRFPLQVGGTHRAAYEVVHSRVLSNFRFEREIKVVGWEEVVVPAGKFRALKIVSEGPFQRLDHASRRGTSRDVVWYVPEVKRWAKITFETHPKGKGRGEYSGEELVDYKLK